MLKYSQKPNNIIGERHSGNFSVVEHSGGDLLWKANRLKNWIAEVPNTEKQRSDKAF